jgi:xylose isomerase
VGQLIDRAATVDGLSSVDLNYPDHLDDAGEALVRLYDTGLALNGFAMRYYSDPAFAKGAFTNPDPEVRRKAIDLTKEGIDRLRLADANLMTIWLGQDGFDYPFQADYRKLWAMEIEAIAEVCAHDPDCLISIEYKPNEPRAFSLLGDLGTTLLAVDDVGADNLGVTLDFAHVLYANENPAMAAALIQAKSKLLGVHLNDGYGKRDDGLMVGAVHSIETVELLRQVVRGGYGGPIYFDTFPDVSGIDPVAECAQNIATVERMMTVVDKLDGDNGLAGAIAMQDAVDGMRIVQQALMGGE